MDHSDFADAARATLAGRRLGQRQALTDEVYEVLADLLMNHAFEPGARLNIDGMARTLGVSPTPVREALARMEAEGLVVKDPRRSYTVAPLIGLEELRALIEFRLLVEPAAAAAAALRAGPGEGEALVTFAGSGGAGGQGEAANRLDMTYDASFHDKIAALGGNPWLRDCLGRLRSHLHMYRLYHHAQAAAATTPEHIAIARAVAAGDAEAAAEAMRVHLTTAMRRIDEVFASGNVAAGER